MDKIHDRLNWPRKKWGKLVLNDYSKMSYFFKKRKKKFVNLF